MAEEQPVRDQLFDQISEVQPVRDLPEDEGEELSGHKTATDREKENPNLSDIQALEKRMFPELGFGHLNAVMQSRVFPDIYNPYQRLLVKDLLKREAKSGDEIMSVVEAISLVNTAESIAIDGEGRIDSLALGGVVHQEQQAKDAGKVI